MSRYFPPPASYDPYLILQLRAQPEGGNLLSDVRQETPHGPFAGNEVVVLVHGFNNHYGEAGQAYDGFRKRQYLRTTPPLQPPALETVLGDVFWPGDAAWGLFDLVDFLVYPAAVGTSRDAAARLARHLRSMPTLRVVHFIGHSLGCRVILETIDDLRQNGGALVGRVCLMAAAVPVAHVQAGGHLAGAMEHAGEIRILFSDDDIVLHYTFPPGQTIAGPGEGFFPTALGRFGPPPGASGRIDAFDINHAGHGDYWGYSQKTPAAVAADRLAEFFRFGSWQRTIVGREAGSPPRELVDSREAGHAREVQRSSGKSGEGSNGLMVIAGRFSLYRLNRQRCSATVVPAANSPGLKSYSPL